MRRWHESHMFLENLSLKELKRIELATEDYILEYEDSDKLSDMIEINEKAKQAIELRKHE